MNPKRKRAHARPNGGRPQGPRRRPPVSSTQNPESGIQPGASHLSRNVNDRMQKIHHLIGAGKYPSAIQLARQFEVNKKTILRDFEWMKTHEKAPICEHILIPSGRAFGPGGIRPAQGTGGFFAYQHRANRPNDYWHRSNPNSFETAT